ncbi:MAG: FKBP-type peptidyl-prolyl cis-trans isomerase [Actinomycetaceae bacterium]|nr:FKBP-type peptidyl-prolyl cis-trans isomerase [Actinomycetaceae bacterium]
MMVARHRLFAIIAACAMLLSGCQSPKGEGSVRVTGDFGAPVSITIDGTIAVKAVTTVVITQGDGQEVTEDSPVLLRATSFDSRSGRVVSGYETGTVRLTTANEQGLGDLADEVIGRSEGSRLVVERPGLVRDDESAVEIVVVDVLYTTAYGEVEELPDPAPSGMPTIERGDGGGPAITAGGGEVPELSVVRMVTGTGSQVSAGDELALQYSVVDADGTLIDTTWNGTGPVAVDLSSVMEGLQTGLVDQRVGSRVVVLIPSSLAAGEGDRVAVVDILGILKDGAE